MQLTQFTDFGLRVLMYLIKSKRTKPVTIQEISEQFSMPRNHLIKVVNRLVKLGWVEATRGRNGGLKLATSAKALGLGKIIHELEETDQLIDCTKKHCSLVGQCQLKHFLDQGLQQFYQIMDQYTLTDAVADATGKVISNMHQSYYSPTNPLSN